MDYHCRKESLAASELGLEREDPSSRREFAATTYFEAGFPPLDRAGPVKGAGVNRRRTRSSLTWIFFEGQTIPCFPLIMH